MPRGGYTIGQGIADAGRQIGGGLSNKWAADEEERRRKAQAAAFVKSSGLDREDPELAREIAEGRIGIEDGMKARKMKVDRAEAEAAADQFMKDENTINVSSQVADNPQATASVFGKTMPAAASPLANKAQRVRDIQSGTPSITPDERANVLRSELRPGDEGLAGVAGRSRSMAEDRQKGIDTKDAESAWETFQSGLQGGGQPMDVGTLGKMELPDSDRLKYAGMTPQQMQKRAREGEPSEGPKWSKDEAQIVRILASRGIPENDPRFPEEYRKLKGGEKADVSNAKVAEVWNQVYQRILSGRDDSESPYYGMEMDKVRPMADSLSQIAVEGMSAAVAGNQQVPDAQAQSALDSQARLLRLIEAAEARLQKR